MEKFNKKKNNLKKAANRSWPRVLGWEPFSLSLPPFSFPNLPLQSTARGPMSSDEPSSALLQSSFPFSPFHGLLLSLLYYFSLLDCVSFLSPRDFHSVMRSSRSSLPTITHASEKSSGGVETSRPGLAATKSRRWRCVNARGDGKTSHRNGTLRSQRK